MTGYQDTNSPSPAKKKRVEILSDLIKTNGEELDTCITSTLYHITKKDFKQSPTMLEKVRRLLRANNAKYLLKLHEINLEICALKQKLIVSKKKSSSSRGILLILKPSWKDLQALFHLRTTLTH